MAARVRQTASLVYLDSHRNTPLTRIAGDIAGEPYAALKTMQRRREVARDRNLRIARRAVASATRAR